MAYCMSIICTLDEARNLPEYLFDKYHVGKEILNRYSRHSTRVLISVSGDSYHVSMIAKGYEPVGKGAYNYTDVEAQEKILEIMLCG